MEKGQKADLGVEMEATAAHCVTTGFSPGPQETSGIDWEACSGHAPLMQWDGCK